jgi:hypothetical protein
MENMHPSEHGAAATAMAQGKTCKCGHHKATPILVILLGLEFFLGEVGALNWGFVNVTWPILVIIAGVVMLVSRTCKCCDGK